MFGNRYMDSAHSDLSLSTSGEKKGKDWVEGNYA